MESELELVRCDMEGEVFQTLRTAYSKVLRQENTWHLGETGGWYGNWEGLEDEVRETGRAGAMQGPCRPWQKAYATCKVLMPVVD